MTFDDILDYISEMVRGDKWERKYKYARFGELWEITIGARKIDKIDQKTKKEIDGLRSEYYSLKVKMRQIEERIKNLDTILRLEHEDNDW
ncbi:MAG: hypothetical protein ACTSQ8_07950 [Candidatus Helarchaeota archaeon]